LPRYDVSEHYEFHFDEGLLTDKVYNTSAFIINPVFYKSLHEGMVKVLNTGAFTILYNMGYEFGGRLYKRATEINNVGKQSLVNIIKEHGEVSGWGTYQISILDKLRGLLGGHMKIRSKNNMVFLSLGQTGQASCFFMRGFFAGGTSAMLERPLVCEELTCQCKGDEVCTFELKEDERPHQAEQVHTNDLR
jgi:predicted hydrocarbon binding protein